MAIIDVVKWEANNKEFCHKFPSEDLKTGTQLVVYSAQTAFFVSGGRICDEFSAGTYTLKSDNLPIINKIINIPFGGDSPFQAEVWFVNQIARLDFKWGTPQPIQLEDPKYHIVAGWTFGVIKSLQQVDLYIFVKIITDMVKKMLFLWVRECGQEWSERPHTTVQMQGLRTPF